MAVPKLGLGSGIGTPPAGAATPPKKGGIDPNTGEWSDNPQPLHVAGESNGQGGHYGVNGGETADQTASRMSQEGTASHGGAGTATPYGNPNRDNRAWDSKGGHVPGFGNSWHGAMDAANMYGQAAYAAQGRTGPQIDNGQANADLGLSMAARGQQGESRGSQQDALALQRAAALGQTPSQAQIQQQAGIDASINAQMAMANSAKGGGSSLAAAHRQAVNAGSTMQLQGVQQQAALRAQEMANARNAYMEGASGIRQGDMALRAQDLQQRGMSADQAYRQATLEAGQRSLNDQSSLGYYGLANQAQLGQLGADTNVYNQSMGYAQHADQMDWEQQKALAGTIQSSTSSAAMMMSDIRNKTDIMPATNSNTRQTQSRSSPSLGRSSGQLSEGTKTPVISAPQAMLGQTMPTVQRPPVPSMDRPAPPMPPPQMYPSSPLMPQGPAPMYGGPVPTPGLMMSDERAKEALVRLGSGNGSTTQRDADINAILAGLHSAAPTQTGSTIARLASGNGTADQRNADIDGEIARLMAIKDGATGNAPDLSHGIPKSSLTPEAWDRAQRMRQGNGSPSDVDAELRRIAGSDPQVEPPVKDPRQAEIDALAAKIRSLKSQPTTAIAPESRDRYAVPAAKPSPTVAFAVDKPDDGTPIENLHQPPYRDYYEDANKDLSWTKDRNARYGLTKETWADPSTRTAFTDRNEAFGYQPTRFYSDENLKVVQPVLKEKYVSHDYGRAKMKNEWENGPEKDPGKFPMQPKRGLGMVASDEDLKQEVSKQENLVDKFLETARPYAYRYRNPQDEPADYPVGGRYLGGLAQNLEQGPTGDTLVKNTPRGKMLEGGALMSAMLAGTGRLHERVKALESDSKAKKVK